MISRWFFIYISRSLSFNQYILLHSLVDDNSIYIRRRHLNYECVQCFRLFNALTWIHAGAKI